MIDALEAAGAIGPGGTLDRADLRQHRHRARLRRRGARLPADPGRCRRRCRIERRKMLALLGAELVLTPGPQGMKGAIAKAEELEGDDPGRGHPAAVREPGQSRDPPPHDRRGDLERHRTARSTVFVSGVGTGGTITGVGQVLKPRRPIAQDRRGRAGGFAGALRRPARAAQDPGHRRRLRARGPRPLGHRRGHHGRQPDRLRHGAARRAARGHPGRHLVRRRGRGGARDRRPGPAWPARPSS